VKFLVDMPLSPGLARWLIDRGHDAVHAFEIGMERASDAEILDRAKQEARTIVTADLDYSRMLVIAGAIEPSLILFRGGDWSDTELTSRMEELLRALGGADMEHSIIVVDRKRFRRRRLPIDRRQ
jgi:predicted nuclease of predicted toxin-antitoxin system